MFYRLILFCLIFSGCSFEKSSKSLEEKYLYALDLYSKENLSEAKKIAQEILSEDKNFYKAKFLISKIDFFSCEYEEAYKKFSVLYKKYPEFTDALMWKIRTCIQLNKIEEAELILNEQKFFNSKDWRVYYLFSLVEAKKNNLSLQLLYLKIAESVLCESSSVYRDMAFVLNGLGSEKKAMEYSVKYAFLFDRMEEEK